MCPRSATDQSTSLVACEFPKTHMCPRSATAQNPPFVGHHQIQKSLRVHVSLIPQRLPLSSNHPNSQRQRLRKIPTSLHQALQGRVSVTFRPHNCPTSRHPNMPVHIHSQGLLLSQHCRLTQEQGPGRLPLLSQVSTQVTAVSDIPRGTLRSSRNRGLSEHFRDRVLFDYVSFIRLP